MYLKEEGICFPNRYLLTHAAFCIIIKSISVTIMEQLNHSYFMISTASERVFLRVEFNSETFFLLTIERKHFFLSLYFQAPVNYPFHQPFSTI